MTATGKGYLYTIFASIGFGLNTIGIRYYYTAFETGTPENVAFWGMFTSSFMLLPYFILSAPARKRIHISIKRDRNIILTVAVLSTIGAYLWMLGLKLMAAGPLSLFGKSQVLYTALLGILFLKERFTLLEFAGMAAALLGIIIISQLKGEVSLTAILYVLSSAFIYSVQSMLVKMYGGSTFGMEFTYLRAVLMSFFFFIIFGSLGTLNLIPIMHIFFLGGISLSGLMAGRAFYYEAHKFLSISKLSIGMLFEPVFILIASYFILDENMNFQKTAGAATVILGLWITAQKDLSIRGILKFAGLKKELLP